MPKTSAANRERISRMKAAVRRGRMLQAKKNGERMIPDRILKQLAALNLPPNEFVYTACLEKLLRGA